MTTRAQKHPAENAATLAGVLAFVLVAALAAALARPALGHIFFGYTPHHLATAFGLVAGVLAGRATYRKLRAFA
jgi:ABC-type transport system involved in cytochrome bd biosynthesis fused ATPase/permease subunit